MSTESGIPDFRSEDGLYRQTWRYPPETILSHDFFMRNTEEFYRFYREKMLFPSAAPNKAHKTLAALEKDGKLTYVVTQNIDGLHQAAGSERVLELHGSVHRNTCVRCGKKFSLDDILRSEGVPRCACGGVIKPDVVLYGEQLDERVIDTSLSAIASADLLLIGGTSLSVYPAAGFVTACRGKVAVVNMSETGMDGRADLVIHAPVGETLAAAAALL